MFKNSMGALLSATHDMLDVSRSDTETLDVEPHELYQPFPPGLAGLRILLAEDNVVDQYLMVRMLEKEGCCVILANTGREVLAILGQESFDLVLMDVHMPGMNGLRPPRRSAPGSKGAPPTCQSSPSLPKRSKMMASGI